MLTAVVCICACTWVLSVNDTHILWEHSKHESWILFTLKLAYMNISFWILMTWEKQFLLFVPHEYEFWLCVRVYVSIFCVVHLTSTLTFLIGSLCSTVSVFLYSLWYMETAVNPTTRSSNLVTFLSIRLFVDKSLNFNCVIHSRSTPMLDDCLQTKIDIEMVYCDSVRISMANGTRGACVGLFWNIVYFV